MSAGKLFNVSAQAVKRGNHQCHRYDTQTTNQDSKSNQGLEHGLPLGLGPMRPD
ncbi:hypothetical protein GCM10010924_07160 [Rhizobium wenxiniae]|nr:hypothetical protein GCM10010924_07160 [Rhizobium wenxiniae]